MRVDLNQRLKDPKSEGLRVICDIECDSLNPKRIWLIVVKEIETENVYIFKEPDLFPSEFSQFAKQVREWIGHNFLSFDMPTINRLIPSVSINHNAVIDTLVLSRLLNYKIEGGHSLDAWGSRFNLPKGTFSDFSSLTQEMVDYCLRDVEINYLIYDKMKEYIDSPDWLEAIKTEHHAAYIANQLSLNGFYFNMEQARHLYATFLHETERLDKEILKSFLPKAKPIRVITPSRTKFGTLHRKDFKWKEDGDLSAFEADNPFTLIEWVPFNPCSTKQIVERLNKAGWRPTEKTKTHKQAIKDKDTEKLKIMREYGWKVSETNLSTLPDSAPPSARSLALRLLLNSRKGDLEEWFKAYNPHSHRIHGSFLSIGSWTGRMSHQNPNTGNITSVRKDDDGNYLYGREGLYSCEMRELWTVPPGYVLLGTDADAIQLRILAHYINDPVFTTAVTSGSKRDGSDIHSRNKEALGPICKSRNDAKTFIYAWLFGAGVDKVASILGCSERDARQAINNFINYYPGLKKLKEETIPADAARGYFIGLDGRKVLCDSKHKMLSGYLQNGEAVIMKKATLIWSLQADLSGADYKLVAFVHDEWQSEVKEEEADFLGSLQAYAIKRVGEIYQLNCPLAGTYSIGKNWAGSH